MIANIIAAIAIAASGLTADTATIEWWEDDLGTRSPIISERIEPSPHPYDIVGRYLWVEVDEPVSIEVPANATSFTVNPDGTVTFTEAAAAPEPAVTYTNVDAGEAGRTQPEPDTAATGYPLGLPAGIRPI